MSMLTWLRGITGTAGSGAPSGSSPSPSAPLSPRLEQERRIWLKAARNRQQFTEARKAQQAREAREEATRLQQAQDEHEDAIARGLALGRGYFPGDADQERGPRIEVLPFEVPQQWIDQQREMSDWRGDRG